jgi:2Fe-2S ferredoxin
MRNRVARPLPGDLEDMPKIKFIEHDGTEHLVQAEPHRSLMQTALDRALPGIIADCGGNCACATCHVYIDESWVAKLPAPSKEEREMLECVLHPQANSRLSCQVPVTAELEGLVVRLPESQT